MAGLDAHQHFWRYDPDAYPWIKPDWPIRRDFLPADLEPLLRQAGFNSCVAVQARQTIDETRWLLSLADAYPFIAGVVGWVDLRSADLRRQLDEFREHRKFAGVRHVVQDEPDDAFVLRDDFMRGIEQLQSYRLTYDLLVFPRQLPAAIKLVRTFPEQHFVLDHIAKPPIRQGLLEPWRTSICELAKSPHVYCKISGMVTEARWAEWQHRDFRPYLDIVWEAFGEDRLMIGSDWPVCLLSANYEETISLALEFLTQFPAGIREKVLARNAAVFYHLHQS